MSHRRCVLAVLLLWLPNLLAQEKPPSYPPAPEVKAALHKLLDRPKTPLDVKVASTKTEGGLVTEVLTFVSEKKADGKEERVPVLIVRPEKVDGKLPAVIALHGTGGNKEGQRGLLVDLAKKGYVGVAIDARYHGERSDGAKGSAAYVDAITRAWKTKPGEKQEHPFYLDTAYDLWRTVDYLESRADVDPKRIGMIGFSMGGIQTWLAAAADERVAVAVPAIAVQSFRWSLDNEKWQGRANTIKGAHQAAAQDVGEKDVNAKVCQALWNKVIPGMLDQFDCPSMLRLFAGRPLLILNGENDANCPLGGAKVAFGFATAAFDKAGCPEKLKIDVAAGVGHAVTPAQRQMALEWFDRWLKP